MARQHGADETLDYAAEGLKDGLSRLTGGRGVDVIYDPVGGELAEPALRGIAWKGRYLVIGFAAGEIPKLPLNLVLLKGCDVQGVFWGSFVDKEPAANAANVARLFQWAANGKISAHASAAYALDETGKAIRLIADRKARGKVLVRIAPGAGGGNEANRRASPIGARFDQSPSLAISVSENSKLE